MRPRALLCLTVLLLCGLARVQAAEPTFPPLTGRVVDRADMLDPAAEQRLSGMLAAHEQATGEQVVVVTLPDLQGRSIEEFGVALGRHWGIGQKGKDNGALLIVAREERRVRIEVGYGLEERLTDAQSALIINGVILPAFRQGDFSRGISEGAAAMIQVLGGEPLTSSVDPAAAKQPPGLMALGFFFMMLVVIALLGGGGGRGLLLGALLGGMGRGSGLGGGGGFGGGGGGFGGGGASGGW